VHRVTRLASLLPSNLGAKFDLRPRSRAAVGWSFPDGRQIRAGKTDLLGPADSLRMAVQPSMAGGDSLESVTFCDIRHPVDRPFAVLTR
jgi:hypothetical protein